MDEKIYAKILRAANNISKQDSSINEYEKIRNILDYRAFVCVGARLMRGGER